MEDFKNALSKFSNSLGNIKRYKIDLNRKLNTDKSVYDFKEKKIDYYLNIYKTAFTELKTKSLNLNKYSDKTNETAILKIHSIVKELEKEYKNNNIARIEKLTEDLGKDMSSLKISKEEMQRFDIDMKMIPKDIREEINADIKELEKCFHNGCYRSSVILCGRLLEAALHRKYYDVTGHDILEKSPGIGLGNLIAKMKEKDIQLEPALTNQIHLINQVRVFSVHKKKEVFKPNKAQAHAVVLYTLDTIEKLFSK